MYIETDNTSKGYQLPYAAYLVRLWQETPTTGWRASAQSVQSGETLRFGSLAALFAFLEAQTAGDKQANAPPAEHKARKAS